MTNRRSQFKSIAVVVFLACSFLGVCFATLPNFSPYRATVAALLVVSHGIAISVFLLSKERALWWEIDKAVGLISLGIYFFYPSIFTLLPLPDFESKVIVVVSCAIGSALLLTRGFQQQKKAVGNLKQEWAGGSYNPFKMPPVSSSPSFYNRLNVAIAGLGTLPIWATVYLSYRLRKSSPEIDDLITGVAGFLGVFLFAYLFGRTVAVLAELLPFEKERQVRIKLAAS